MDTSPKVLSIVWNLIRGGTEGQCARVVLGLRRRGHPHRVAVFRREGYFLDPVEQDSGPVFDIGIRRMLSPDTFMKVKALQHFIEHEKIELVHTWDADAAIFGSLAARWAGIPLITSRRDLGAIYPPHKQWLMARADRQARAIVVNAAAIQTWLQGRNVAPDKIRRIANILDHAEFDRLAGEPLPQGFLPPQGLLVGMVCRLDPEKDVDTFLYAAAKILKTHPTVAFLIAGDGQERSRLENLAKDLSLADRVHFLGEINSVPALVKRLDVGVLLPRANEGLSNTILEYMAAGKPVVATDCGGNAELVQHGENGYVVPTADPAAAAAALVRLLDDPARAQQMGKAGRQRMEGDFSPETILSEFADLYRQVGC